MTTVAWLPVSPGSNFSWSQERDFEAEHVGDWFDLFNGQDLGGWEQKSGSAKYKVVDGSVEGTTSDGSSSSLLRTRRDYADFELKFEIKVNNALNSTVQVRSSAFENSRTDPEITNAFKNDDWNQYRILAIGDRIQTWVNGVQVVDRVGKESAKTGFIGLTVHSDPAAKAPHKVAWKNIRIRELNVELAHSFIGFGKANCSRVSNRRSWTRQEGLALYRDPFEKWKHRDRMHCWKPGDRNRRTGENRLERDQW